MARNSAATMMQKVGTLRQITGGKPFVVKDLPDDVYERLEYKSEPSLFMFVKSLVTGTSYCGRQLVRVGWGKYAWLQNPSMGGVKPEEKPVSPHFVARDFTSDEVAALDLVQEILIKRPDGFIRLIPSMVALESEEFLDFMDKLESVKAVAKIGANQVSEVGHVWGVVRDKFTDFYRIAQAVQSGQYEFSPEPVGLAPEIQPSPAEERLEALCQAMAKELAESRNRIKKLQEDMASAQADYSEEERRYKVFCSELGMLRRSAKPSR